MREEEREREKDDDHWHKEIPRPVCYSARSRQPVTRQTTPNSGAAIVRTLLYATTRLATLLLGCVAGYRRRAANWITLSGRALYRGERLRDGNETARATKRPTAASTRWTYACMYYTYMYIRIYVYICEIVFENAERISFGRVAHSRAYFFSESFRALKTSR